jgi:hypothetical protein
MAQVENPQREERLRKFFVIFKRTDFLLGGTLRERRKTKNNMENILNQNH